MSEYHSPALPAGVTSAIRHLAFQAGHWFLRFGHSRLDLEQELTLHYLRHCHKHNAKRASAATFAARICRHRLLNMFEAQTASMRSASGGLTSLSDSGLDKHLAARVDRDDWPAPERVALRVDLDRALARLPIELASLALLLAQGASVTDVVRTMGIPRATVYRRLARLRRILTDAGLRAYLAEPRREHVA